MVVFFGAVLPRYDVDFSKVVDSAVMFEDLGFSSLWVTDHLQPRRASRILESWTLLSALAPLTDARLGTVVLCSCYRHPSLLAKMAGTLDVISNGRLELGIGTGSEPQAEELESLGMEKWPPKETSNRFREYVTVLRLLLKDSGAVDFDGKFYRLSKAVCNTPSVQRPTTFIWIGARKRKMIQIAAELGDGWNFYGETLEEYRNAVAVYDEAVKNFGRKPSKSVFTNTLIYSNDAEKAERLKHFGPFESEEGALRKTFTILHGTPDKVIKQVEELKNLGAGLIILRDMDPDSSNVRSFAREVLPSFS
ncbi:MAG: LLM class flavin-dependent oxidoreductase [Candidatus Caldarchaeum sp.]